jgi:hypothetical protein
LFTSQLPTPLPTINKKAGELMEEVPANQRIPDPLRRALMLLVIPVVFVLTAPLALVPILVDPLGFEPISLAAQAAMVIAVGAATAAPILAGANAASIAASTPLSVPPRAIRQKTVDVMGWTWSVLAGLIPAALLALLHERIGYEVFWCIHSPLGGGECLPVNYGVIVPNALPTIMPPFFVGLLITIALTWAALRLGVLVGRRVRNPARAVMWVTGQVVVVLVALFVAVFVVLHPGQNEGPTPGRPEAHLQPVQAERRIG